MDDKLRKLQKEELKILKKFIKICEENKLQYFLIGGSAIGALRHGGFIPWDDDIDVGMPRKDFDKFMEIGQSKLPKHLFLQNSNTEKKYNLSFAKIRNSKTTFIEKANTKLDINQGIFIDIFPIDGVGNDINKVKKIYKKYMILHEKFRYKLGNCPTEGIYNKIRNMYYFTITSYDYIFKGIRTTSKYSNLMHDYSKKYNYNKCKYVMNYAGQYFLKEVTNRKVFGKGRKVKFEGIDVLVPVKAEEYLTDVYGDFMKLPPEEKRVAPHFYILDLDKSYKEYLDIKK